MQKLKAIFQKYREQILYLIFGGVTTVASWIVFYLFTKWIDLTPNSDSTVLANIIANVVGILVAFLTNRTLVFQSDKTTLPAILREAAQFTAGRLLTIAFDLGAVWLFADTLHYPAMPVKIIVTIIVIVLNYIISKLFVFKKKPDGDSNGKVGQ